MPRHRLYSLALLCLVSALMLGGTSAPPAQAAVTHISSFGGQGAGPGQFSVPGADNAGGIKGIAVNYATGDVYVADRTLNRITQFSATGTYIRHWGGTGTAKGGFQQPQGIAVDNSSGPASGSVYVQDAGNNRVQRFTADGQFVLMWGKGVNQGTGGNVCTAAPADTCQAGTQSRVPSSEAGVFAGWTVSEAPAGFAPAQRTPNLAVDGSGYVYVGEVASVPYPRVQKFNPDGSFVSQIAPPNTTGGGGVGIVNSLGISTNQASIAASADGAIYVADDGLQFTYALKPFSPESFTATGLTAVYEPVLAFKQNPRLVAIDPSNGYIFTFAAVGAVVGCTSSIFGGSYIEEYHPAGERLDCSKPTTPSIVGARAIAMSASHRLYVAVGSVVHVFDTPVAEAPDIGDQKTKAITTTSAIVEAPVSGNLAQTSVHVEYGSAGPCSAVPCASTPAKSVGASILPKATAVPLGGLTPGTTYHYRLVATSDEGVEPGPDRIFTTFAAPSFDSSCPNNLARQQTGAAFLPDCRSYELVSAEDTGGYNVESDLAPRQMPYGGFPYAVDRALYAVNGGAIPGSGNPTNRGQDPYLATRDPETRRWATRYVGLDATMPSSTPFSSTLAGADRTLSSLAFGGPEICHPCFSDGTGGLPLRLPDGSIVQGMAGSLPVLDPQSSGEVRKPLSPNGRHFIFASKQQFETAGNPNDGNVTVYDRDLQAGTTQVVSTMPNGETMADGEDVAALDVSEDGSRILIGKRVPGNAGEGARFDLYMHIGSSTNSVEIADTPSGVLYNGMTGDGTRVFFTTADQIGGESDSSVDLFRADVGTGTAAVVRLSDGADGAGDNDDCQPIRYGVNVHWNSLSPTPSCDVTAIAGGTGIASEAGSAYFFSPEQLDGAENGVVDAPNLYRVEPGGTPEFVMTMESELDIGASEKGMYYTYDLGSFADATGVAPAPNGDLYVYDTGDSPPRIERYSPSGKLLYAINGSETPNGHFRISASQGRDPKQIAVDPLNGDLYIPDASEAAGTNYIHRYDAQGEHVLSWNIVHASAVAVHPTNHEVYTITSGGEAQLVVRRWNPLGVQLTGPNTLSNGATGLEAGAGPTGGIAFNSTGSRLYLGKGPHSSGAVTRLDARATIDGTLIGTLDTYSSAVPTPMPTVDVATDDVYVRAEKKLSRFTADGESAQPPQGFTPVNPIGIAFDANLRRLYVADRSTVRVYTERFPPDERAVDNPAVIAATNDPETPHLESFQGTPDGSLAVFVSARLPGDAGHASGYQVIRYDAAGDELACLSCSPTRALPSSNGGLASKGLSLLDDGRIFFTTGEQLVLRDTNKRKDVYEWSAGKAELISTGAGAFDSDLLSASVDGIDVFFFTRERLVPEDRNGKLVKLYTAREEGGSFLIPPPPPCAAADECRGPGSQVAAPPSINTVSATNGNAADTRRKKGVTCRKGFVKRAGKCVRKKQVRGKRKAKRRTRSGERRR